MTENIYDLANALERALRQLPEYKAVEAAKAQISLDQAAQALWQEFVQAQTKLQEQVQAGAFPTAEEQAELERLGRAIEANPILSHYFAQQQALSVYVSDIERLVFGPLRDLI